MYRYMNKIFVFILLGIMGLTCSQNSKDPKIVIETEYGNMSVKLYDSTPKHKENFIKLVKEGYYKDLLFHRVIPGFMIQGGDPDSKNAPAGKQLGAGGPGYTIPAEIGQYHFKGALAAARTGDQANPEKRSSGSQFYIVQGQPIAMTQLEYIVMPNGSKYFKTDMERYAKYGGTPFLDGSYTVFGEVTAGMEVIDKIAGVQCDPMNRPVKDVKMNIVIK
ncbi:MAG: peptidylprolyl isomerase [Saprospiraceae bacterium]|nr:peptidylprolyl isomerase [Saprospiraceae bacterium]